NDARCKHMFDNPYGTGQTTLTAVLALTNVLAAGREFCVVGYGWVGRGLARTASGLGGRVTVVEIDPVRALTAHMDGHRVAALADALPDADVVLTATGLTEAGPHEAVDAGDRARQCLRGAASLQAELGRLALSAARRSISPCAISCFSSTASAPASAAARCSLESASPVRTIRQRFGWSRRRRATAVIPSSSGMCRSTTTASTSRLSARSIASRPFCAAPTSS